MKVVIGVFSNNTPKIKEALTKLTGVHLLDISEHVSSVSGYFDLLYEPVEGETNKRSQDFYDAVRGVWDASVWLRHLIAQQVSKPDGMYLVGGVTDPAECKYLSEATIPGVYMESWFVDYGSEIGGDSLWSRPRKGRASKLATPVHRVINGYDETEQTANQLLTCVLSVAPRVQEFSSTSNISDYTRIRKVQPQADTPFVVNPHKA